MSQEISSRQRAAETRLDAPATTGFAFLDMMLQMQRASQHALSSFIPLATNGVLASNVQATNGQLDQRIESKVSSNAPRTSNSVEVIPVGEETFHVGTRTVQGETTRLRRVVVETPVEQQVALRTETVIVERRKPASSVAIGDVLSERSIEMSDSFQVVETWKSVYLREEVVLRTEVVERTETVRDVVRRDEVQVEQARATTPRARVEAPKRDDKGPAEQPVAKQIAQNAETIRPDAHARQQDAAPPVPVKAEAERPSPAPVPAPARPAAPEAAALPTAQNSQLATPQPENKPNTPPRPEANQSDKPSNVPGRRA